MDILIDAHPLLDLALIQTRWPEPLQQVAGLSDLDERLSAEHQSPVEACEQTKSAVRDLLRVGGFKPTGRSKPASEYLIKARDGGFVGPINPAVDACNIVSLHSGLPISVVDVDQMVGPLKIGLVDKGVRYVFNPSGQEIDVGGLICLHDAQGPCGGPVKDSQRTKTHPGTEHTLSVVWGTTSLPGRTEAAAHWYAELMTQLGGVVRISRPEVPRDPLG
jgi:DNA/RNA-binding domain of Phe-tRNA-synthetase-like protein